MARRMNFIFFLFFLIFCLIIIRLFLWQIASSDRLGGLAEKQRLVTLTIPAQRGKILASDGSPLVINQTAYGIYLEPYKISDREKTISFLSKELDTDPSSISAQIKESLLWIPIAHKLDEEVKERIESKQLSGVVFTEEDKRYYPEASMAAHMLGFVGKNAKGEDQGYFGLEGYYDEQLRGRNGVVHQETDAFGNPILAGELTKIPAENGRDLTLYLDKTIQYIVETKLREGVERFKAKGGSAVVFDPESGGILAMASLPSYDPAIFSQFPTEFYKNPAISLSYEPGSTFKTLIMASALNEGKVTPETKYNEEGPVEIKDYTINTWNKKYHGEITLSEILQYSSNVGMVFVGSKLGKDLFLNYLERLDFGDLTGIDLQEEATPPLRSKSKWYDIDFATASFGQGIAVTPLQMVRAVGAIASGGRLLEPHVVKSIKTNDGKIIYTSPKVERIVFKPEVTRIVAEMMVSAVDNGETSRIKPPGFRIAGKTGTAQIPIAGHYDTEKTIASFVGFAPVDKPRFVMLVTISEPSTSPWGSETAAPIFFSIAAELFSYLGISPSD